MSSANLTSAPEPTRRVSIVTPFYNEAGVVAIYFARLGEVLRPLSERLEFEFVCVNDGSRDETLRELQAVKPPFGRLVRGATCRATSARRRRCRPASTSRPATP